MADFLGLVSADNPPGGVTPGPRVTVDPSTDALSFVDPVSIPGASQQAARVGHSLVPDVWYKAGMWNVGISAAQLARDVLRAVPFVTGRPFTIDRIAFYVSSVGGAGSRSRIGIYRAASGIGLPTDLVLQSGEFLTDSAAGLLVASFAAITLSDPVYWFAFNTGGTAVTPTMRTIPATDGLPQYGLSAADLATPQSHVTAALVYAALPSVFPTPTLANANYPVIACRGV